jgi:hypothetical protein
MALLIMALNSCRWEAGQTPRIWCMQRESVKSENNFLFPLRGGLSETAQLYSMKIITRLGRIVSVGALLVGIMALLGSFYMKSRLPTFGSQFNQTGTDALLRSLNILLGGMIPLLAICLVVTGVLIWYILKKVNSTRQPMQQPCQGIERPLVPSVGD